MSLCMCNGRHSEEILVWLPDISRADAEWRMFFAIQRWSRILCDARMLRCIRPRIVVATGSWSNS